MNFHQPLENWQWGGNRMELAVKLATGKSVLHVGCVDEGMVSRETLHQKLSKVATELCGSDVVDLPSNQQPDGSVFSPHDFQSDVWPWAATFDIVICTEVLEHLDSVGPFLRNLRSVGAKEYFFSVPNAFSLAHNDAIRYPYLKVMNGNNQVETMPTELVHPDHRCWFSPYTLENVLRKAGYTAIDKWMVGWGAQPTSLFTAEGVGVLCQ